MPTLTAEGFQILWKQTVDSKAFEIQMTLQDLQDSFGVLSEHLGMSDKISLIDRDIQMMRLQAQNLVRDVSAARTIVDKVGEDVS